MSRVRFTVALVALGLLLCPLESRAQENLAPILERGYIAHWLVCGPFPPDVPGGILGAVASGAPVLGDTDHMAPLGGIARTRPDHLLRVTAPDGGEAIWQRAGTTGPELDLKPFFPARQDGIAYAAFYTVADRATAIFLDVQSPLGVRMWVNGFPARAYEPAPPDAAGVTQVAVRLRAGNNLVVMEVPGADSDAIARALNVTSRELAATTFANRPRLRNTSGFAISARVRPAEPLGSLYYVPELEEAGTFSGGAGDARQDTWLTLHNPVDSQSEPVDLIVSTPASAIPDLIEVAPIDALGTVRVPVPVPVRGLADGAAAQVTVRMHSGGAEASFRDAITVRSGADQPGIVRIITGHTLHRPEGEAASESTARSLETYRNQVLFLREGTGYGFDLGHPSAWHAPYTAHPELRADLLAAAQRGAVTVRARYAPVDERIAGGLLLWRNLQIGLSMNQGMLKSATPHFLAWNAPGLAPQTPQLLQHTPILGLIGNAGRAGLPPLARYLDLHGGARYLRHKQPSPGPANVEDLQDLAAVQRRELLALGSPGDVLVVDSAVNPPEPFYRGAVANLARSFPRIVLDGGGGAAFFDEIAAGGPALETAIPPASAYLNTGYTGDLLSWPMLKRAQARSERQLATAETLATFASLEGAVWPHAALDVAARQLAFYSTPAYLSAPATRDDALDALAGFREVAEIAGETAGRSLAYIAEKIDTAGAVPLNAGQFEAIVAFNPTSQIATLPVRVRLPATPNAGVIVLDGEGTPVPAAVRPYQETAMLEFMGQNLPALGHATYFMKVEGPPSAPASGRELQIENEYLALFVAPATGAIARIEDKRTGARLEAGPLNDIAFLASNDLENNGGRDLHTTGPASETLPPPLSITSEHTAFRETIVVTTPMRGGLLERRYTLALGQPWVHCYTRLRDVDLRGRAAFAAFTLPHAGRGLIAGERFGAISGARGHTDGVIQTDRTDNRTGSVVYPAHRWAAVAPGDAIQVGPDRVFPLEPAVLVYGDDPVLRGAAEGLQAALIRRAIPAILHQAPPEKPDFLWTDATKKQDLNAYLHDGYRMRVVIGSPEQNPAVRGLLAQADPEMVAAFAERIPQGARLFLRDAEVPNGFEPAPSMILAGITPAQTATLVNALADAVKDGRRYLLPPSAWAGLPAPREPEGGCAILFPGSAGVTWQRDGRLLVGLAHRTALERTPSGGQLAALMPELQFEYAIHPFSGDWRRAQLHTAAEAAFTAAPAVLTGIHPGPLPVRRSWFGVSAPGLHLTGFKPAGFPHATQTRDPFHPRNGFALLAWETAGEPWQGEITSAFPMLEARRADAFDMQREPLTAAGHAVTLESRGFQVHPIWLLPGNAAPPDGLAATGRTEDPHGPIPTRYWDEHRGAAPIQHMPLSVLLRGSLDGDHPIIEAVISNHLNDKTIEGSARLMSSAGISFGPREFPFSLAPGRQHVEPIHVAFTPEAGTDRALALEATYERQTARDVLAATDTPAVLTLSRSGAQLRAEIRNNGGLAVQGVLDAIVSPAHWPETGRFPEVSVQPRRQAVNVPPYKSQTLLFTLSDPAAQPEVCARLSANGAAQYQFFPAGRAETNAPASTTPPPPRGR
ncbi:MAG: hypothetical protein KF886_07470 [Candidatus Hydrogenedentes bacterium]|nr:hypothetical protein [Candidatus Hydrogenedentota bacterium]